MQFGTSWIMAITAAGLCGCASEEVKNEPAPAPMGVANSLRTPNAYAAPTRTAPTAAQQPAQLATKPAAAAPSVASVPGQRSVYYDFDKYDVRPEFRSLIQAHAKYIGANASTRITIEGNCDERGSREYNLALGQRRADSVKSMLKILGVPESGIETVSYGEEKPADPGHDEMAWSKNRRSDIVYKGKQ